MSAQVQTESVVDILLKRGVLTAKAAEKALGEAAGEHAEIEKYLVTHNVVSDVDMALALATYLGTTPIQLTRFTPDEHLIETVSADTLKKHLMIPVKKTARMLTVAMADPFDVMGLDEVQAATGMELVSVVAPEKQIQELLQKYTKDSSQGLEDILRDVAEGDDVELGIAGGRGRQPRPDAGERGGRAGHPHRQLDHDRGVAQAGQRHPHRADGEADSPALPHRRGAVRKPQPAQGSAVRHHVPRSRSCPTWTSPSDASPRTAASRSGRWARRSTSA